MIFANKLNYTLLSIYSINKNGKKNYNLYKIFFLDLNISEYILFEIIIQNKIENYVSFNF